MGFERAIALKSGETLNRVEGWILCDAVALLMIALIAIGATSEIVQKKHRVATYVWPQAILVGSVLTMGQWADRMPSVALVAGLLLMCVGQMVMAQRETFLPKRSGKKCHSPEEVLI